MQESVSPDYVKGTECSHKMNVLKSYLEIIHSHVQIDLYLYNIQENQVVALAVLSPRLQFNLLSGIFKTLSITSFTCRCGGALNS